MNKTLLLLILTTCTIATAGTLESGRYYTWRIPDVNIVDGEIITGGSIKLDGLDVTVDAEGEGLVGVYFADNPPDGWTSNDGWLSPSSRTGALPPVHLLYTTNDPNAVMDLANIILPDSWTHRVFPQPFLLACPGGTVLMSSAVLELNDMLGNGTPGGLLIRATHGTATVNRLSITLTIRTYTGAASERVLVFSKNVPTDLIVFERERKLLVDKFVADLADIQMREREAE